MEKVLKRGTIKMLGVKVTLPPLGVTDSEMSFRKVLDVYVKTDTKF